ncbi:MAG TPA: T9SS type A sorting domain-containing protein [bacterium]|jgi:hypothetical protein
MTKVRKLCVLAILILLAARGFASDNMFMAFDVASQKMQAVVRSNTAIQAVVTYSQSNPSGYIGDILVDPVEANELWAEASLSPADPGRTPGIGNGEMNVITAVAQLYNAHHELLNTLSATDTLFASVERDGAGGYTYGSERDILLPDSIRMNSSFCAHIAHGTYVIPVVCENRVPGIVDPNSVEVYVMNGCADPNHCTVACNPIDWPLFSSHIRSRTNCRIYLTMAYCGADTGCVCIWRSDRDLPVQMTGFSALAGDNRVMLSWGTGSESGLQEFRITRSTQPDEGYSTIARVTARNAATGSNYTFTDNTASDGVTYYYKLHVAEISGHVAVYNVEGHDVIAEATPRSGAELPVAFRLEQNYPNPFNSQTSFSFSIPAQEHVTLKIYDMLGRDVATVVDRTMPPNFYTVNWSADGLAAGLYMYRMTAGSYVQTRKMLYIK